MGSRLNVGVNYEVGAGKRLAGKSGPVDDRTRKLIDQVQEHGYAIIHDAFRQEDIVEAKAEIQRITERQVADLASARGRNSFEGFSTRRIYALANKSRVLDKFALHPDVLALNDHFLDPGYLLSSFQSITIEPGESSQSLHHDDGYATVPRPHHPFGTVRLCPPTASCTSF